MTRYNMYKTYFDNLIVCCVKEKDKQIIQNKARQEVIRILGDEKKDVIPTVEDCNSMVYLDILIKEVISCPTHTHSYI